MSTFVKPDIHFFSRMSTLYTVYPSTRMTSIVILSIEAMQMKRKFHVQGSNIIDQAKEMDPVKQQ